MKNTIDDICYPARRFFQTVLWTFVVGGLLYCIFGKEHQNICDIGMQIGLFIVLVVLQIKHGDWKGKV